MFHEQKPPFGEGESKVERHEGPPQKVVRVFLFQSEDPKNISPETPIDTLNFTRVLFIRKGGEKSFGKLMPPGGTIELGESVREAAINEVVEETHLRFVPKTLFQLHSQEHYSFQSLGTTKQDDMKELHHRCAVFARAKLLPAPLDLPYVLDPDEDKIQSFVLLSLDQLHELFEHGEVVYKGERMFLLDSLLKDKKQREQAETRADQQEIENVHKEILLEVEVVEWQKKLSVLSHLLRLRQGTEDILGTVADLQSALSSLSDIRLKKEHKEHHLLELTTLDMRVFQHAQSLWHGQLAQFQFTHNEIQKALRASNIEESIRAVHHGVFRSKVERRKEKDLPSLHLLLPLFLQGELDMSALRALKENTQTANVFEMLRVLFLFSQYLRTNTPAAEKRLRKLCDLKKDDIPTIEIKHILDLFHRKGWLHNSVDHTPLQISQAVNDFLDDLREEIGKEEKGSVEALFDQVNEIKSADFQELCGYAFGNKIPAHYTKSIQQRLQWEAQRKLLLMLIYNEAFSLYRRVEKLGIEPIQKIEDTLEHREKSKPGDRVFVLDGKEYHLVVFQRPKKLGSVFRKMIVRDTIATEIGRDIFGEALIFLPDGFSREDLETVSFPCAHYPIYRMTPSKQKVESLRAPLVITRLVKELCQKGSGAISIEDFKEFGVEPTEIEHQLNPGSSGKIRFWKWNIVHTDENSIKRYREAQVFLPQEKEGVFVPPNELGGDYKRKKMDDERYKIFRLFDTKGLRSFIELFYPVGIYGNAIRETGIFKNRVTRRARKQ